MGDANCDGLVSGGDLAALATGWNAQSGAIWSDADFNGDGAVTGADLAALATNWNRDLSHEMPAISAALAQDTAPGGSINDDGITYDPSVAACGAPPHRGGFGGARGIAGCPARGTMRKR